jgi:glycine/D-amino acid oxidase-like deaminating enzyme
LLAAGAPAVAASKVETKHEPADVLVVGGGPAGITAAIQAARAGAKTVLVEMCGQLGGTTTIAGVNYPGLFHAWGKQVIAGIGWELVRQAVELDSGRLPDFTQVPKQHWRHQVRVNPGLYAMLAEEACVAAGVAIHYYEFPRAARPDGDGWVVETAGKGVERAIGCRQLIDCTGGADVVGMLGLPRLREKVTQPGTLIFELGNYKTEKLDAKLIQQRYEEAVRAGRLKPGDHSHGASPFIGFLAGRGMNAQHVFGADSSTAETKTQANLAGRASLLRVLRFVRSLPGCENAQILRVAQETGIRETYRIAGELQITQADYVAGRRWDDSVAHAFYPIDIHDEHGVRPEPLPQGVVPTVPLRALVPKGSRNLLVAGRSIASDRGANSALRVQASCMAMGQAAGAAAALAAKQGCTPLAVPLEELKTLLRAHGAIVP